MGTPGSKGAHMAGYDEERSRSLAGPTELRIHGVGGTAPENLLRGTPVLVAGTTTSGFYRLKVEPEGEPSQLEAYSWGGLTSGGTLLEALRKALWLLLLPFTLINAAGWMMPRPTAGGAKYGWGQRLLRWLAQFTTIGFALSLAAMSVDMIALQCGSSPACAGGHTWLSWLNFGWLQWIQGRPAGLMAVGLIVPVAALAVLWFISRSSTRTSEGEADPDEADEEPQEGDDWETQPNRMNIARPGLWGGAQRVLGMTRIHFGTAFAALAAVYAGMVVWLSGEAGDLALFSALLCAYAIGIVVWGWWLLRKGGTPGVAPGKAPGKRPQTWWLLRLGVVVLLLAVAVGWLEGPTWTEVGSLTALDVRTHFNWFAVVAAAPMPLIIVLSAAGLIGGRRNQRYGMAWMTAFLGLVAGVAFLATLALWIASLVAVADEMVVIDVWNAYEAAMVVVLALIAVVIVRVVPHLFRLRKNARNQDCADKLDKEFHDDLVDLGETQSIDDWKKVPAWQQGWLGSHRRWLRGLVKNVRIMQYTADRAVDVAKWVAGVALAFWIWAAIDAVVILTTDGTAGFGSVLPAWGWVITLARWLAAAMIALVFGLVADSYRNQRDRRRIGTLWDVLTFWPRWFHPVTPPSYAATAVPQLRDHLTDRHRGQPVVVAAHSQGAVLGIATVARMNTAPPSEPAAAPANIALLTFGNPARRLYGRFFPAYFGLDELRKARAILTSGDQVRWRNLTRCADPIGGVVLVLPGNDPCVPCGDRPRPGIQPPNLARRLNDVDWLVPDPYPVWPPSGDPLPSPKGHSNYDLDHPYPAAVKDLFGLLPNP